MHFTAWDRIQTSNVSNETNGSNATTLREKKTESYKMNQCAAEPESVLNSWNVEANERNA